MKRILTFLLLTTVCLCAITIPISAQTTGMLSPALKIISESEVMVCSELMSGEIRFTKEKFELGVGGNVDQITITALPPSRDGTLMYGNAPVSVNQVISSSAIDKLRFVPASGCLESSFRFKSGGDYSFECMLRYTKSANYAPIISATNDIPVWTQMDISTYGTLTGSDPEGDKISFEITSYPEQGILHLLNSSTGDYRYTPCNGVTGTDSFTYIVRDEWGNYSEKCTVLVDIDKQKSDLVLADMNDHWAHNAALVMVSDNTMDVTSANGEIYFNPAEEMTREEFLVTVMKALGAGEIPPSKTVFSDHDLISEEATGYVARAYRLGVIKGVSERGKLYFNPAGKITRAEAAVILNTILGMDEPDVVPVFSDSSSVPAWAKSSLYALSNAGIFKGTGSGNISANAVLNRAQVAQILFTIKNLY